MIKKTDSQSLVDRFASEKPSRILHFLPAKKMKDGDFRRKKIKKPIIDKVSALFLPFVSVNERNRIV